MSEETKQRLLKVHSSGLFNALSPEKTLALYYETKKYLAVAFLNVLVDSGNSKDLYDLTELQFYLALITGHDTEAKLMLDRLSDKFGDYKLSQRIAILKSIYIEATGSTGSLSLDEKEEAEEEREGGASEKGKNQKEGAVLSAMDHYSKAAAFLENVPHAGKKIDVIRRRSYLTGKLAPGDPNEYIRSLNAYLLVRPSDAQTWYELGDTYLALGNYAKAVYCFQQILLATPFAYNVYYKLGTTYQSYAYKSLYDFSSSSSQAKRETFNYNAATVDKFYMLHSLAVKHFLKSVELAENYPKGWAGAYVLSLPLKFKNKNLLDKFEATGKREELEKLNALAKKKLHQIVERDWTSEENKALIKKVLEFE